MQRPPLEGGSLLSVPRSVRIWGLAFLLGQRVPWNSVLVTRWLTLVEDPSSTVD